MDVINNMMSNKRAYIEYNIVPNIMKYYILNGCIFIDIGRYHMLLGGKTTFKKLSRDGRWEGSSRGRGHISMDDSC